MRPFIATVVTALALVTVSRAKAAELSLSVEIPRIRMAEYHRPYVAIWLEDAAGKVTNLALWYNVNNPRKEGDRWLRDTRQWWRKAGRVLDLPLDGVSSPTRSPGAHTVRMDGAALQTLPPGPYKLTVEAAREKGDYEILTLPVQLPVSKKAAAQAKGETELGLIRLIMMP